MGAFKFGLVAGKGMNVEIFLASLYKSFPAEVAPFFFGTQPLEELVQELSSIDLSVHEIAPATNPGDPGKMLMSKMDERLVDLLTQTATEATELGKSPADVADFMRILSRDARTTTQLKNDLGLIFRSHSG